MTDPMDFPPNPTLGQRYNAPGGMVYEWDGYGWTVGYYDSSTQELDQIGDILEQVRTLLQDTDNTSEYRYSTDSLVAALNQGMMEMFRVRPDIFLEQKFKVPVFNVGQLDAFPGIEAQYIPPLIYYVVGLAQLRDDEQNQDARAAAFMKQFLQSITTVG